MLAAGSGGTVAARPTQGRALDSFFKLLVFGS